MMPVFTSGDFTPRTVLITPGSAATVASRVSQAPLMTTMSCANRRKSGPAKISLRGAAHFFDERQTSDSGTRK